MLLFATTVGVVVGTATFAYLRSRMAGKDADPPLELDTLVQRVSDDLWRLDSLRTARGEYPMFSLSEVTLEVAFVVRTSRTQDNSVKFEVIALTEKSAIEREKANKVVMKLQPLTPEPTDTSQDSGIR